MELLYHIRTYGRYLQFRFLKWPLTILVLNVGIVDDKASGPSLPGLRGHDGEWCTFGDLVGLVKCHDG